jgi:hypothetical protein
LIIVTAGEMRADPGCHHHKDQGKSLHLAIEVPWCVGDDLINFLEELRSDIIDIWMSLIDRWAQTM